MDAGTTPVDLLDTGEEFLAAILPFDPVADAKGGIEVHGDAGEEIGDEAASGEAEDEAEDSGSSPDSGDGLLEDKAANAGGGEEEDEDGDDVFEEAGDGASGEVAFDEAVPDEDVDEFVEEPSAGEPEAYANGIAKEENGLIRSSGTKLPEQIFEMPCGVKQQQASENRPEEATNN